jgi:hypothetical protein
MNCPNQKIYTRIWESLFTFIRHPYLLKVAAVSVYEKHLNKKHFWAQEELISINSRLLNFPFLTWHFSFAPLIKGILWYTYNLLALGVRSGIQIPIWSWEFSFNISTFLQLWHHQDSYLAKRLYIIISLDDWLAKFSFRHEMPECM